MRLNLVNVAGLISAGLSTISCERFNPKFGSVVSVNEELFKYVLSGPPKEVFFIERISLNDLFEGNPQSIEDIAQRSWSSCDAEKLNTDLKLDLTIQESPVLEWELPPTDQAGEWFHTWVQFVGLGGLPLGDVDLSTTEGWLHVDARRSSVFSGTVSIKVKVKE